MILVCFNPRKSQPSHLWTNKGGILITIVQILRIRSKSTPLPFPLKVAVYLASHLNLGPKFSEAFLDLRRARRHAVTRM